MIEIFSAVKFPIILYFKKLVYFCKPSVKQNVLFYGSNNAVSHIENGGTKMNGYFGEL